MKTIFTSSIILLFLTLVLGCKKRPEKSTGEIKVLSGIYPSVSKGLESGRTFHISTLSFSPKGLIESALEPDGSRGWHHLGKEGYWTLPLVGGIKGETPTAPLSYRTKQSGAPFLKGLPPGYARREELSDTLLFKKRYRRFEIRTPHSPSTTTTVEANRSPTTAKEFSPLFILSLRLRRSQPSLLFLSPKVM